jgi:hypothetical protein
MAMFQKSSNDSSGRFDTGIRRLVMMFGETAKIDLWGAVPGLVVDVNARQMVSVSESPVKVSGLLSTYELTPLQAGHTILEARFFDPSPTLEVRHRDWFLRPVWDFIQLSVMGNDYMQSGGTWGNLKYGSTNPAWKDVPWTNMGQAGCGPTALADVLDYLFRLFAASGTNASVTPRDTMSYASRYGRAALPDKDGKLAPQGTSGDVMLANVGKYWPGYAGEEIKSVDLAIRWLRTGTPLIFLATGNVATWKYDQKGTKQVTTWGGHYMVLLGVESNSQGPDQRFWVADPSLARTKYTDTANLSRCRIWRVYKATS